MGNIVTGWLYVVSGAFILTAVGVAALVAVGAGAVGALLVAGHVLSTRDNTRAQAARAAQEAQLQAEAEARQAKREAKKAARREPARGRQRDVVQAPPSRSAKPRRLESLKGYELPEPEPSELRKDLLELAGDIDEWRSGVPLSQTTGALRAAERRQAARHGVYRDEDAHRSPKWAEERHRRAQPRKGKGKGGGQFLPKPAAAMPDGPPMTPGRP